MTNDIMMVFGIVAGVLSIPSLLSAYSESRPPRVAAILGMTAATLIAVALVRQPGGYTFAGLPDVFTRVVAHFLR